MGKRIFAGNKAICWNARYQGFEDSEDILKGKKPLETPGGKAKTELRGKCFHVTLFDVLCTVLTWSVMQNTESIYRQQEAHGWEIMSLINLNDVDVTLYNKVSSSGCWEDVEAGGKGAAGSCRGRPNGSYRGPRFER